MTTKIVLSCVCLFIVTFFLYAYLVLTFFDLFDYPISRQNLDNMMGEKYVINSADIQSSRVYIVFEDDAYQIYAFQVGNVTNRFQLLFVFSYDSLELNCFRILGRWRRFFVCITDDKLITYQIVQGHTRLMERRINPRTFFSVTAFSVSTTMLLYNKFLKERTETATNGKP